MFYVVYFDKRLGTAHSKCWQKSLFLFSYFLQDFDAKMKKNQAKKYKITNSLFPIAGQYKNAGLAHI